MWPIVRIAVGAALAALASGPEVRAGEGLYLTAPDARGAGAHYERLERLRLDRKSGYNSHYPLDRRAGYGQPSRILGAPLDLGPAHENRPPGRTRVPAADAGTPEAPPPAAAPSAAGAEGSADPAAAERTATP